MVNRIYLAGIVEREGRILLIRQTPRSQWELPGGPLLQRHSDADLAMSEIMTTFGITFPDPEERFIDTIYLPEGDSHLVYNIYASSEWEGEPEIPIGMGAGWYALDELDSIDIREEVRRSILVTFGLVEEKDDTADILKAFASDPSTPMQPPLAPLPEEPRSPVQPSISVEPATDEPAVPVTALASETQSDIDEESSLTETMTLPSPAVDEPVAAEVEVEDVPDQAVDEVDADEPAANIEAELTVAEAEDEEEEDDEDSNVISFPAPAATTTVEEDDPGSVEEDDGEPEAVIESPPPAARGPEMVIDATRAPASQAAPDRRSQGFDVLRTLGRNEPAVGYERMKAQYGELADDIVDFALGEVWYSDGLERKQRSLIVVAMIAALGGKDGPLFSHINGALNHGATPDEIVEVMRTVAVYAGFPAALEAWGVMEDVFRQRRVTPTGRTK